VPLIGTSVAEPAAGVGPVSGGAVATLGRLAGLSGVSSFRAEDCGPPRCRVRSAPERRQWGRPLDSLEVAAVLESQGADRAREEDPVTAHQLTVCQGDLDRVERSRRLDEVPGVESGPDRNDRSDLVDCEAARRPHVASSDVRPAFAGIEVEPFEPDAGPIGRQDHRRGMVRA